MWINYFFILSTIETIGIFIVNLLDHSSGQEKSFLVYSVERWVLLAFLLMLASVFILVTVHLFKRESRIKRCVYKMLNDSSVLWVLILGSILLSALIYFLFIQPEEWFGGYLDIFQHFRAVLVWLLVLSLQTLFFILIWYCVTFCRKKGSQKTGFSIEEMDWVALVFLISLIIKIIVILPNTYGLYKDVGESKYFNMVYYLFEGKFVSSADDVTTHYPFLYPLMLVFSNYVKNHTFQCILLINSVFASSIVFPLYLLARRFLHKKASLVVIILSSLIPFQFLIPNRLLSENLYFPLLLWGIYLAFVRPDDGKERFKWDLLTGFSLGLLYLTRFITLALIPFLLIIWWMKPFEGVSGIFHLKWKKILHAAAIVLAAAVVFSPWVLIGLNNQLSLDQTLGFGITAETNPEQLTLGNLAVWVLFYAGYFVLMAAPLLNLIVIAFKNFGITDLKDENSRWLLTLLVLLAAFSIAVVRHSWRAYYNLEQPEKIMGRYVIYFVPLFLLAGFLGLKDFKREKYRSCRDFGLLSVFLPAILTCLSYVLVISGKFIVCGNSFIQALISIDGFYIQQLGNFFFIFMLFFYCVTAYFLWHGRNNVSIIAGCMLAVFYLAGEPACFTYLETQNTYQKLGYTISEKMLQANEDAGRAQAYIIYLSDGFYVDDRKDFAWSLYVRNLESEWEIVKYPAQEKPQLDDENMFIIYPASELENIGVEDYQLYEINDERFIVEQALE